ncbi:MAG: EamA family transporter RarD [Rhodospirillales bacterium]
MQDRARLRRLAYSSVWVSINWGIFIWAIAQGETLQSSLGYYIAPLVNIALGVVFLGERLAAAQWAAVALAACGVVWLAAAQGVVPWIALSLAVTFGFYALTRKRADVDGLSGLCVETAILAPLALGWIIWLGVSGDAAFLHHSRNLDILLLAAGVVTAVPFILFAEAARRLPLSTIGLLQYLTPTGHLLVAVFAFGEDFTFDHAVTFAFIWTALAVYSASMGRQARRSAGASSSSVYGENTKLPFSTADRCDTPKSLYAATKMAGEDIAYAYTGLYGMALTGLRFFTVYGPWGRPDMAAYIFTRKMLAGEPIQVFNQGDMRRDFTYVDDIAAGVIACLDNPPAPGAPRHRLYNLGNNRSEPLMRFIEVLQNALGVKAELDFQPLQPGDVPETFADIEPARRDFGFEPKTAIDEGLPAFADWHRRYHGA